MPKNDGITPPSVCKVEGCDGPVRLRGWCNKHYLRWSRHGDPLGGGMAKAPPGGSLMHCNKSQCPGAKRIGTHLDFVRKADAYRQRGRERYHEQQEARRQTAREYAAMHRQEARDRVRQWKTENPERYRANNARNLAKYREHIVQATPAWGNWEEIDAIYQAAPKGCHVDHIVPIRGKNVCGLHVPWNLRHIPDVENMSKGNRFDESIGIDRTTPGWIAA